MGRVQIQVLSLQQADVDFFSDNLTDEQIARSHLISCRDIGSAVEELLKKFSGKASICVCQKAHKRFCI